MEVKQFRVGGDRNFGYLVADEDSRKAAVVDPSFSPDAIVAFARKHGWKMEYIFTSHGHGDHTNGNRAIERMTGIHPLGYGDRDAATGKEVRDGEQFPLGGLVITVIHTPGHSADSMCLHVGDALFTGDTLFVGKVGGTDFADGARREYDSLHKKLMALTEETRVFPGHDYGTAPESTIGNEKKTNPFLLQPDFDSFVHLKMNWAQYKKEHGIA